LGIGALAVLLLIIRVVPTSPRIRYVLANLGPLPFAASVLSPILGAVAVVRLLQLRRGATIFFFLGLLLDVASTVAIAMRNDIDLAIMLGGTIGLLAIVGGWFMKLLAGFYAIGLEERNVLS
jgi:hypothetical protein